MENRETYTTDLSPEQPNKEDPYQKLRTRKRGTGAKIGFFVFGMAVGIVLLLAASNLLQMRIGAVSTINAERHPESTKDTSLNREPIEKLQVLEQCIRDYYY